MVPPLIAEVKDVGYPLSQHRICNTGRGKCLPGVKEMLAAAAAGLFKLYGVIGIRNPRPRQLIKSFATDVKVQIEASSCGNKTASVRFAAHIDVSAVPLAGRHCHCCSVPMDHPWTSLSNAEFIDYWCHESKVQNTHDRKQHKISLWKVIRISFPLAPNT